MIDQHLRAALLRARGDNHALAQEVQEKLSPQARERLFRVLQELEEEASRERSKRRRGQFV